jgi:uncharacterized membrane protein YfcA
MIDFVIIGLTGLFGAFLTFFCGFGLGTIMLPVMALFFPLHLAIIATSFVHFGNNLFKVGILFKGINLNLLLRFGIPAILFALFGAWLMEKTSGHDLSVFNYQIGNKSFSITLMSLLVGSIIILFAFIELFDILKAKSFSGNRTNLIGGALSGFFGGFSGHQGALRSAFLVKGNVDKTLFLATSACIGLFIDFARIIVYTNYEMKSVLLLREKLDLLIVAVVCALVGSFVGSKLLKKQTISSLKKAVGIGLFVLGSLILTGLIH